MFLKRREKKPGSPGPSKGTRKDMEDKEKGAGETNSCGEVPLADSRAIIQQIFKSRKINGYDRWLKVPFMEEERKELEKSSPETGKC